MKSDFKLVDVVALLKDYPEKKLVVGQIGTIVEILADDTFGIEFCNNKGETLALAPIKADNLLLLHYELIAA